MSHLDEAGGGHAPSADDFSPIDNEPPLRWARRLRLAGPDSLGAGTRALILALLGWLPIAAWALATGRVLHGAEGESLVQHYAVHVRGLIVIPLLVLAEPMMDRTVKAFARRLADIAAASGAARAGLQRAARDVTRLRDATLPWVLLIGAAVAWSLADTPGRHDDAVAWAVEADGSLGFGGWWYGSVLRPIVIALLLAWLWRIVLLTAWCWRVGRLDLALAPAHPDRTGGIGFVGKLPGAFALVSIAVSSMLASRWAHEVLHHGIDLMSHRTAAILFALLWTLLLLLPQLALTPLLLRVRAQSLAAYSALVHRQGRLAHERWIEGRARVDDPVLDAPELGPLADTAAIYDAVKKMRPVPVGMGSIAKIVLPLAIPMLVVAALQVPLKDLLLKLAKLLF
jgi:hypothetical protein